MAQAVGTISSTAISTSTLQTYSVAKTITATANHVVQPFGKYTLTKTGTIYAANGVDNVTITLSSGFPSFSSYVGNSTYQAWASGCQKEQDQEKGANLVISYIGTACGIAPTLKVSFSPLPTSTDSCDLYWSHESYSWCGDAGFSYSGGTLTIVPPSATFDEDPTVVQHNNADCGAFVDNKCNISYSTNVSAGNALIVAGQLTTTTSGVTLTANDSQSNSYSTVVSQGPLCQAGTFYCYAYLFSATAGSSGALTLSVKASSVVGALNIDIEIVEVSGISLASPQTGVGTNTGTAVSTTSVSWTDSSIFAMASVSTPTSPSFTAGASFTAITSNRGSAQYSTSVVSPSTFPATLSPSTGWAESAAVFNGFTNAVYVLSVSQSSSGMILMPTINNAPTTVTAVLTLTATCCTTNTFTVIGVPWASQTFAGWSGATTWIQNTLNPTQTITYSSFTTSTLSSTLTAQFSGGGGGATTSSPDYTWLLLLPFAVLAIALIVRRR